MADIDGSSSKGPSGLSAYYSEVLPDLLIVRARDMPEMYWNYGYAIPAVVASAIASVAILMLRRKGWL